MVIREKNKKNKHVENIGTIKVLNHNQKKRVFCRRSADSRSSGVNKGSGKRELRVSKKKTEFMAYNFSGRSQ